MHGYVFIVALILIYFGHGAVAFSSMRFPPLRPSSPVQRHRACSFRRYTSSLGDFTLELEKPLGIILEERTAGGESGVRVKEIAPEGSAAGSRIVPGDVILQVNGLDLQTADFDAVMDSIISSPPVVRLSMGDGLGTFDMPKNVLSTLKSKDDAFLVDAVVREAVREIRRNGRLGDVIQVEVVIGAGSRENGKRGMARFFAIFSTDGVSTYSCNVAASGIRQEDGSIKIVSLSCAKDEGLGQTYDLILEEKDSR